MINFRKIAFIAIMSLALASCQKEDLQPVNQNDEVVLPREIVIGSATPIPSSTNSLKSAAKLSVADILGTYMGTLNNIKMKDKPKDNVSNIPISITQGSSSNTFDFYLAPFSIGKMPGHLSVDIDGLTLKTNGTFHADNEIEADLPILEEVVSLKKKWFIGGGTSHYNASLIEGSFTAVEGGYLFHFVLETNKSIWNLEIFKAHVEYDGTK